MHPNSQVGPRTLLLELTSSHTGYRSQPSKQQGTRRTLKECTPGAKSSHVSPNAFWFQSVIVPLHQRYGRRHVPLSFVVIVTRHGSGRDEICWLLGLKAKSLRLLSPLHFALLMGEHGISILGNDEGEDTLLASH
jgi:hypothetical protein